MPIPTTALTITPENFEKTFREGCSSTREVLTHLFPDAVAAMKKARVQYTFDNDHDIRVQIPEPTPGWAPHGYVTLSEDCISLPLFDRHGYVWELSPSIGELRLVRVPADASA